MICTFVASEHLFLAFDLRAFVQGTVQVFCKLSAMSFSLLIREPEFCAMLSLLLTREFSCETMQDITKKLA